jgi:hypothetical protein
MISKGPSVCFTASICFSFNVSEIGFMKTP